MFSSSLTTFDDVVTFCEGATPEGVRLDYKRDLSSPESIAKTISAMANTHGGTVIIGVLDEDDKPKPPFDGMPYREGYAGTIENVNWDHVDPPVEIQIRVCANENKSHCFVIVDVPQSDATPHGLKRKKAVYLRTGQKNQPEELIDLRQLPWLYNKREKCVQLRELLCSQFNSRFLRFCHEGKVTYFPNPPRGCTLTLRAVPLFPIAEQVSTSSLIVIIDKIRVQFGDRQVPCSSAQLRTIPNGVATFRAEEYDDPGQIAIRTGLGATDAKFEYSETNSYGCLFHKEQVGRGYGIVYQSAITTIAMFIVALQRLASEIPYQGLYKIDCALSDTGGKSIQEPFFPQRPPLITDEVVVERVLNLSRLQGERETFILDILSELSWGLDFQEAIKSHNRSIISQILKMQ